MHYSIRAYQLHKLAAHEAFDVFVEYCGGNAPRRVPGCDTAIRLAVRIHNGKTIPEAAAREYLYRWQLAIKAPGSMFVDHNPQPVLQRVRNAAHHRTIGGASNQTQTTRLCPAPKGYRA